MRSDWHINQSEMGRNFQHFKALMRKNLINWKRTPVGSVIELLLPTLLMLILVIQRGVIKPYEVGSIDVSTLQHPSFPMASLNSLNNTWTLNAKSFQQIQDDVSMQNMMRYANYTNTGLNTNKPSYNPVLDVKAPFMFNPPHCQKTSAIGFKSPIIAYIKNNNQIQADLIAQLKELFDQQFETGEFLANNKQLDLSSFTTQASTEQSSSNFFTGAQTQVSDQISFQDWRYEFKSFDSKEILWEYLAAPDLGTDARPAVCFGFSIVENSKNDYELELIFNDFPTVAEFQAIPSQRSVSAPVYAIIPQIREYAFYQWYGFSYLQNWVANAILKRKTGLDDAKIVSMTIPMKMKPFVRDDFQVMLAICLYMMMVVMFLPTIYRMTFRICQEKEMKTKESMMMMGLKLFPYWASWYVYYLGIISIQIILVWCLMFGIFKRIDMLMVGVFYFLFALSNFGWIMTFQALFSKARIAAIVATTCYLSSILGYILTMNEAGLSKRGNTFISLFPCAGMSLTTNVMLQFETSGIGIGFNNWDTVFKGWSVKDGMIMMAIDNVIWMVIGIYLEMVMPKEFGKPVKPWFMFLPSWWCPKRQTVKTDNQDRSFKYKTDDIDDSAHELQINTGMTDLTKENIAFETKHMNPDFYEPVPAEISKQAMQNKHLEIKDLFKVYGNGFKAVNGVNLKMYSDQIFVLLGHNGAGKTTTISMLTGLFESTEGSAKVFGVDMFNQTDELRQFMGVCPQHEVLFELLTPQEHLDIFYDFKGADPNPEVKWAEINKLLVDVGVDDKRHSMCSQLSGGNQRKVSVCVALCGNSKFVLLDEPSSGLDLSARRQMWNMLKEAKKDRIIILTTHYMDEADILGDRIAIMSAGKVTCLGTSMFLKHKFGVGYTMTVVKQTSLKNKSVLPFLRRNLGPEVKKLTEVHQEMTFQIPNKYSDKFKTFFKVFDYQLSPLQIQSYGISITTLEEVFLKVGHLTDPTKAIQEIEEKEDNEFDPYNPLRTFSHPAPEQEMMDFDKKMDELLFKKKLGQDDIVTSQLLDPKSAVKEESSGVEFSQILDDPKLMEHIDNRFSDQIGLQQHQTRLPRLGLVIEDDEMGDAGSEAPDDPEKLDPAHPRRIFSAIDINKYESLFEKEKEVTTKYSLKTAKLERSFMYHLKAVFFLRWSIYKRNLRGVLNEMMLPALIALCGILMSKISFYQASESKILSAFDFPRPNKILINTNMYDSSNSDTRAEKLWNSFPEINEFEIYPIENFGKNMTYDAYQNVVTNYGWTTVKEYPWMYGSYEAWQINKKSQQYKFFTFLNMTNANAAAHYPQFAYESILKIATDDPNFKFKVRNSPWPITHKLKSLKAGTDSAMFVFMQAVGFCVSCAMIIGYLIAERGKRLKHMMTMTGLRLDAYWAASFVMDFIKLIPPVVTVTAIAKIAGFNYKGSWVAFMVYPFGILPYLYCTSFLFTVESVGQTVTLFSLFLIGTITPGIVFVLRLNANLFAVGDYINWVLRFNPNYAVGSAVFCDANCYNLMLTRQVNPKAKNKPVNQNPLALENVIADAIMILCSGIFWTIVLIAVEKGLADRISDWYEKSLQSRYPQPINDIDKDEDVRVEENRVKRKLDNQLEIKVQEFRKCYMTGKGMCNPGTPFLAVEKLSFGLSAGECFCLLGVNGAGKSTTFKSLTCEVKPTSGTIKIAGFDIQQEWSKVRQLIGYCPQTNPIFDTMSVEEHIDYYARIKGISAKEKVPLIEEVIQELGLDMHRTKCAGDLSGGNKRKLSVAIAIIGNPQIILLDEPSAGMDPESRRFMWQVVAKISNEKTSSIILTTHLMEEAEALSTKMGIMVKGGMFKCFGSSQHIKNKFGTGYVIEVKIRQPTQEEIQQLIDEELPKCGEVDINNNMITNVKAAHQALSRSYSKYIVNYVFEDIYEVEPARVVKDLIKRRGSGKQQAKKDPDLTFVSAQDLAVSLFTQNACIATIEELCQVFGQVELMEKYGGYMSLRVTKQNKTIGFVFGYLDEIKTHCDISEYSVSQTTLEQIFQCFANLKFDENAQAFSLDSETGDLVRQ